MNNETTDSYIEDLLAAYRRERELTLLAAMNVIAEWLRRYAPAATSLEVVRSADTGEYFLGEIRDSSGTDVVPGWSTPYLLDFGEVTVEHGWNLLQRTTALALPFLPPGPSAVLWG